MENQNDYLFSFSLDNKNYNFRKWKVRDRLALNKCNSKAELRQVLVYNCLQDKNVIFDDYQYQYALLQIRAQSYKNTLSYTLDCDNCGASFNYDINIKDFFTPINSSFKPLKSGNITFLLQPVQNRDFYDKKFFECKTTDEKLIVDFALHVKSINDNENLDFNQVLDFINNMNVDDFENIINQWNNSHFRIETLHKVICPKCNAVLNYDFDTLPNFFPASWNLNA